MSKKVIVISAVSIFEGGPLSILFDCLKELNNNFTEDYIILAFTNKNYSKEFRNIHFFQKPLARKSYFHKLLIEYYSFKKISYRISPYLWLSLHDLTPNVKADKRAVYCHNSSPFYKISWKDLFLAPKIILFHFVYLSFYKINIFKNNYIIVQQDWLRELFHQKIKIDKSKIIVAYPSVPLIDHETVKANGLIPGIRSNRLSFFYPSFPRVFKNFEIILEAAKILNGKGLENKFQVVLTLDGSENSYSKWLRKKNQFGNVLLSGRLSREKVYEMYNYADVLIFPSKLESWGLPLTEFKSTGKPVLASDLPYAKEAIGNYEKVIFFNPDCAIELASIMEKIIEGNATFHGNSISAPSKPFANSWNNLLKLLTE